MKTVFDNFINKNNLKIFEFLIEGRGLEYTLNDIITNININRQNGYRQLHLMFKNKTILKIRKVKYIQFYKLNMDNNNVKLLVKIFDNLINQKLKQMMKRSKK